jgi:hypothetical protein
MRQQHTPGKVTRKFKIRIQSISFPSLKLSTKIIPTRNYEAYFDAAFIAGPIALSMYSNFCFVLLRRCAELITYISGAQIPGASRPGNQIMYWGA